MRKLIKAFLLILKLKKKFASARDYKNIESNMKNEK